MVKIVLEDKGQDLLWLKVNEGGLVASRRAILPDTPSSAYHQRVSEI